MNRVWESRPEQSLAFTILLRPSKDEQAFLFRFTALAALALAEVLEENYGLAAKLKWPNDVLLNGAKVCGILTETLWQGTCAEALAIGMGVNLGKQTYESAKPLRYQATSLEEQIGQLVPPLVLLEAILKRVSQLRPQMGSIEFIQKWNEKLAFKGEKVKPSMKKAKQRHFALSVSRMMPRCCLKTRTASCASFILLKSRFLLRNQRSLQLHLSVDLAL